MASPHGEFTESRSRNNQCLQKSNPTKVALNRHSEPVIPEVLFFSLSSKST